MNLKDAFIVTSRGWSIVNLGVTNSNAGWHREQEPSDLHRSLYIIEGTANIEIDDNVYDLYPGHYYIFPSHKKYRHFRKEHNKPFKHLFINFWITPDFSNSLVNIDIKKNTEIYHLINYIINVLNTGEKPNPQRYKALVQELIISVQKHCELTFTVEPRLMKLLNYIHDNYEKNITLKTLASSTGLSTQHCCRLFKEKFGRSPIHYVFSYKMGKALSHLLSEKSVI
jgi:AraC-like DNA-binding protein